MADYISREAAIKEFCDDCMDREWCKSNGDSCSRIKNINAVPAADVRPVVRGRWEKRGCYAFCSNCGERKVIAWTTTAEELVNVYRLKFCNNCGADMRG